MTPEAWGRLIGWILIGIFLISFGYFLDWIIKRHYKKWDERWEEETKAKGKKKK